MQSFRVAINISIVLTSSLIDFTNLNFLVKKPNKICFKNFLVFVLNNTLAQIFGICYKIIALRIVFRSLETRQRLVQTLDGFAELVDLPPGMQMLKVFTQDTTVQVKRSFQEV